MLTICKALTGQPISYSREFMSIWDAKYETAGRSLMVNTCRLRKFKIRLTSASNRFFGCKKREGKGGNNLEPENNSKVSSKTSQSDASSAQGGAFSDT
jgi:hypothetical protein